jgi:hypothetical protein
LTSTKNIHPNKVIEKRGMNRVREKQNGRQGMFVNILNCFNNSDFRDKIYFSLYDKEIIVIAFVLAKIYFEAEWKIKLSIFGIIIEI